MRNVPSVLGKALALTLCLLGGDGRVVLGDTSTAERPPGEIDPFAPYPLGPDAISYEQMSPSQQDEVDAVQATTDAAQTADSVASFARATADTVGRAKAEIAARSVGLSGTEEDAVIP